LFNPQPHTCPMRLKTILNHVHPIHPFVYGRCTHVGSEIRVEVDARENGDPWCGGCGKRATTYDTSREPRRFEFVPLWAITVVLLYCMRRVDCADCGVTTEMVPWADGKQRMCNAYRLFLARWARRLSWSEVARTFKSSWGAVYRSIEWVVAYGLAHRDLSGVQSIGIDEIAVWSGHRYLTVVYQIDEGARRLLWIGHARTKKALRKFFDWFGKARTAALRFVCSDMWRAYITVIEQKAPDAVHVLDRFHIVSNMNKVIDKVRAEEAREMARKGFAPILKNSRWCFLKRRTNLKAKQRRKLADVLRYTSLRTVRTHMLGEALHGLWRYTNENNAWWYLEAWCTRALRSRIAPVKRFARSLRKYMPLVLNYFKAGKEISAAVVEGFNLRAKLAIRKAFGFRTAGALETALYHQLGRLPEPPCAHTFC